MVGSPTMSSCQLVHFPSHPFYQETRNLDLSFFENRIKIELSGRIYVWHFHSPTGLRPRVYLREAEIKLPKILYQLNAHTVV